MLGSLAGINITCIHPIRYDRTMIIKQIFCCDVIMETFRDVVY